MKGEDTFDQTLRWMRANLSGALNAVYPPGHPQAGDHCTNSGTGTLICCYIDALGKVLMEGRSDNRKHFDAFLQTCMQDFLTAGTTKRLPATKDGHVGAEAWIYEVYRCGFVHQFCPDDVGWARSKSARYWTKLDPVTLNIDRFARGFLDGLEIFREEARQRPHLRSNFSDFLLK